MRSGHPSAHARWVAAQRLRLERSRPSTPAGDVAGERRLYRSVAGRMPAPAARSAALALRTRAVDREVAGALGGGTDQIVLLGAGYDGRPLRFAGAARWYEVERAETLADKRRRVAAVDARCHGVVDVPLDLEAADPGPALAAAGHAASWRTLWICEDLALTFPLEVVARLLGSLRRRAAPGSTLVAGFTVAPPATGVQRALRAISGRVPPTPAAPAALPYRPGDPEKLMVVTGWRVTRSLATASSRWDAGTRAELVVAKAG